MTIAPSSLPPALPAGESVLDAASLRRLHELDPQGTSRVVERVLRAFDASLARLLPQAREALARGDLEAVRHVAHTLKSSSASVGALQLSSRCAQIESLLRAQCSDSLGALMSALDDEAQRVRHALRALLPDAD